MKLKSKKSALLLSFTSLLLCFAMLAGSTFAWFTDTATTGVNRIQSGTLDVGLEMAIEWDSEGKPTKWANAEGKTLTFKTADNRAADKIFWEPNCTYKLPELRVVNNGNLALKYKLQITGIQGDAKLNKVIEWKINGEDINLTEKQLLAGTANSQTYSEPITISGHMKKEAGNEYQNLTIDGISITVYATQLNSEFDSIDNTYDKDAEYVMRNATIMSETDGKTFTLEAGKTYTVGSATVKVADNGDITYTNTSETAQTVTINTEGGKLTVNAPKDTVNHHGEAEFVEITAIAGNSYHEFGKVSVLAITEGRAVIENGNNAAITQLKGENALVVVREGVTLETKLEQASNVIAKVGVIDANGSAIESKTVEVKADVENVPAELEEVLGSGKTIGEAKDYVAMIGTDGYESLAAAVAAAQDGATIKLAADVEGAGLMTEDKDKAPYRKEITIDFNGHTYTAKNPGVGSKGTESQAMHWGASVGAVTLKNGSFIVKQGASEIRMAMQNYVKFTAENMVFDFTKIPVVNYDENEFTGANEKYNGKECPMFNNNLELASKDTMTLKNCTLDFPENSNFAGIISGVLTLDNTAFNGYLGFNAADGKIILQNGSAIKGNTVKDYFDNLTITEADGVWTAVDKAA